MVTPKILLVDDNEADNFLHKRALKKAGYSESVFVEESVESALDTFSQHQKNNSPFEIIILDINMPGFSGWDFIDKLKDEFSADIQLPEIFIMTTSYNPDDKVRAKGLDCVSDFITKPLTLEKIKLIIK